MANNEITSEINKDHQQKDAPGLDPSQFWKPSNFSDLRTSGRVTKADLDDKGGFVISPLWHTESGENKLISWKPTDNNDPLYWNPDKEPREFPRDNWRDWIKPPEPVDPQKDADQRDGDRMMQDIRSGNLEDLKEAVGDMSPTKLKRVAEQLKAKGFEMQVDKDGRFVIYDKNLKLGVAVGPDGKTEVVEKDKDGNFVKSSVETEPSKLLENFAATMPPEDLKLDPKIQQLLLEFEQEERKKHPLRDRDADDLVPRPLYEAV